MPFNDDVLLVAISIQNKHTENKTEEKNQRRSLMFSAVTDEKYDFAFFRYLRRFSTRKIETVSVLRGTVRQLSG